MLTFPHTLAKTTGFAVAKLTITVHDLSETAPTLETDESYSLSIQITGATLTAETIYGAMRGLETISQMITFDFDAMEYVVPSPVMIEDSPRFPHRGLMIDVARHWESIASLKILVDSLPYAKMNVLHVHLSDSQSFPFESSTSPNLWKGAHSPEERYTKTDMKELVEYARLRGIRVMVEYDMPGHADSWCIGYPEVCPSATCTTPLNVASEKTFKLIQGLLDETKDVFVDNFVHLGGDEVNTACWNKTESIAKWLSDHNMTTSEGYAFFTKRVAQMVIDSGRRPVQWSEVYDNFKTKLPKEVIVHIWKSVTDVAEVVGNGYNVLLNVGYFNESWYLDNLNIMWDAIYANEPCNKVPDSTCGMILGGHGEMWGETVDGSDVQNTVWPRLAAIAERLWSPRSVSDTTKALPRLEEFRCLLLKRGIAAAPVQNKDAREAPPGPGSCSAQ